MGETTYQQTRSVMDMADVMQRESTTVQQLLDECQDAADKAESLSLDIRQWLHPDDCQPTSGIAYGSGPEEQLHRIRGTIGNVNGRLAAIIADLYQKGACAK
jgi:hypothetical protein